MDGGGYPDGLAGHEIPEEARIVALTEAWGAMVADRPVRPTPALERPPAGTRADVGARSAPGGGA